MQASCDRRRVRSSATTQRLCGQSSSAGQAGRITVMALVPSDSIFRWAVSSPSTVARIRARSWSSSVAVMRRVTAPAGTCAPFPGRSTHTEGGWPGVTDDPVHAPRTRRKKQLVRLTRMAPCNAVAVPRRPRRPESRDFGKSLYPLGVRHSSRLGRAPSEAFRHRRAQRTEPTRAQPRSASEVGQI
jgi:hypothetical protein